MNSFQDLTLSPSIQKALNALQFSTPTPIQAQAIPVALEKKDVIGIAQTGTGKTAAFCVPLLSHLQAAPGTIALVLVPTRELASQIEVFWKSLTKFSPGFGCVSIIGGMKMQGQIRELQRRPRLIIATPGRLVDHLQRGTVKLANAQALVLDEADRMLDMGFAPQLSQILRFLPQVRQTLFFSATWSPTIDALAAKYLRDPVRVTIGESNRAAPKITQTTVETTVQGKNGTLLDLLNARPGTVLVFARTQSRTDRVARYLSGYGLEVSRIHGGRTQGQRNTALQGFRSGKVRILVATDIAARGIDIPEIGHVINYDLPQQAEDYVHRIGRTGRAGAEGEAVSILTPEDRGQWKDIQRLLNPSAPKERPQGRPAKAQGAPRAHSPQADRSDSRAPRRHSRRRRWGQRAEGRTG